MKLMMIVVNRWGINIIYQLCWFSISTFQIQMLRFYCVGDEIGMSIMF